MSLVHFDSEDVISAVPLCLEEVFRIASLASGKTPVQPALKTIAIDVSTNWEVEPTFNADFFMLFQ